MFGLSISCFNNEIFLQKPVTVETRSFVEFVKGFVESIEIQVSLVDDETVKASERETVTGEQS